MLSTARPSKSGRVIACCLARVLGSECTARYPLLERTRPRTYTGLAFSARGGYAFFVNRDHALRITLEVIPAFYGRRSAVGTALLFEWQLL